MNATTTRKPMDRQPSQKKPRYKTVFVPTDDDLADRWDEAEQAYAIARSLAQNTRDVSEPEILTKALASAKEEYDKLKEEIKKNSIRFTFRSIGRKRYSALVDEHPPTDEQKKKVEEDGDDPSGLNWNYDSFPPALLSACAVEPELTLEEAQEMWDSDDWTTPELAGLLNACVEVNTARGVVSLGKD